MKLCQNIKWLVLMISKRFKKCIYTQNFRWLQVIERFSCESPWNSQHVWQPGHALASLASPASTATRRCLWRSFSKRFAWKATIQQISTVSVGSRSWSNPQKCGSLDASLKGLWCLYSSHYSSPPSAKDLWAGLFLSLFELLFHLHLVWWGCKTVSKP